VFQWVIVFSIWAVSVATPAQVGGDEQLPTQPCETLLEEVWRIGVVDGDERYLFGQVLGLAAASDGSVFVADGHPQTIRQFDTDGEFVQSFGREGEGPGEFASIAGIATFPDGRVAIWDSGNRRITVYERSEGRAAGIQVLEGVYAPAAFSIDERGDFYVKAHAGSPEFSQGGRIVGLRYHYLKVGENGEVLDTVDLPEETAAASALLRTPTGDLRPFPVEQLYALGPTGELVVGTNSEYAFEIRSEGGAVRVERPFQPIGVGRGERREWQEFSNHIGRRTGRSFPSVPSVKPAYRSLWVDSDGRVWVHRYSEARQVSEPPRGPRDLPAITMREPKQHDIFTPSGAFETCVVVPQHGRVFDSSGADAWGVAVGPYNEEYIVRWRLVVRGGGVAPVSWTDGH
jgi:hypothetical protein